MSFSDELRFFASGRDSKFADAESHRIVERWLEFGNPDDMWDKLFQAEARHLKRKQAAAGHRPRLNAKEFIQFVLSSRYGVERLIAHELKLRRYFEEVKTSLAEHIKFAESPSEIEDAFADFKLQLERLDKSIYDFHAGSPVSRKDQNGSRTRKAFADRVEFYLIQRCGAPMSALVTELMDIVFDQQHTEGQGRIARRPTTKAGRSP